MESKNKSRTRRTAGLVVLLLIGLLTLAACGGGSDPTPAPAAVEPAPEDATTEDATTEDATTEDATTEDAPVVVDAPASTGNASIDAVANALRAQADNLPMRVSIGEEGSDEFVQIEIASPTRIRLNAGDMMLLLVDDQLFLQDGEEWIDGSMFASIANPIIANYVPSAVEEAIGQIDSAEQLADGEVNGEATSVYDVTTSFNEVAGDGSARFHVRQSDGLLVRVESDESDGGSPVIIDYEYDDSIVVEVP